MAGTIPWDELFTAATRARAVAYAPYSDFHVGAALFTDRGQIVPGCNVENASYGLSACAERNALARAVMDTAGRPVAIAIVTAADVPTPPCGACRQVLAEFGDPSMPVRTRNAAGAEKQWTLEQLLPDAFTAKLMNR